MSFDYSLLPAVNASLNGLAGLLLAGGYLCIRTGHRRAHMRIMCTAFGTSTLFLVSYLIYHAHHAATPFAGGGAMRVVYYALLASHVTLAVTVVPMALLLLWWASHGRFARHRRLARWTLPIWLYVSVTGVLVYLMLYQWYPSTV